MDEQKKILVIDDDDIFRVLVSSILKATGRYRVIVGENGKEGIQQAKRELPDLIILDIMMPHIDGYQVCQILRENVATRYIPIIIVSAKGGVDNQVRGLELGADGFITKPFNHPELVARVDALIRRNELSLDANPLTRLPGNISIERELVKRLARSEKFAVGYADLDDFKAFNDKYGFALGDRVIVATGRMISQAIMPHDFVGHVGGDDFVFITTLENIELICRTLIKMFDREILKYYDEQTRLNGYIESLTRTGEMKQFPLMSISIAGVTNCERHFTHFAEIVTVSTELKKYLKTLPGSNYLIDRRKDDAPGK